jgi:hypothetical protein
MAGNDRYDYIKSEVGKIFKGSKVDETPKLGGWNRLNDLNHWLMYPVPK